MVSLNDFLATSMLTILQINDVFIDDALNTTTSKPTITILLLATMLH